MRTRLGRWTPCLTLVVALLAPGVALAYPSLGGVIAHSRDDIPGGFTTMSGDNVVQTPTMPFSVTIAGVSYNTVAISTNGWMEFGGNTAGDTDPTNDCLPTAAHTNPFLAFYWDDMRTINTAIRYGTVGTAPGRVFIVDADIETVAGPSHDVTMQVQVHEGSGLITVKYDDVESESGGQGATLGWQGAGGSGATARPLGCNARILDDNTLVDGWSIDTGMPAGTALAGFKALSRDDISGFTTISGNDTVGNATMPFSVNIDGTSYSALAISTNGWIEFGGNTAGDSDPTNDCLPTSAHTNPFLAAFWDDTRTINEAVRHGVTGTSPNRVYVVDFAVENNNAGNNDIIYQVQIHEGSGLITTKYLPNQNEANGQTATIGWQSAGGASSNARSIGCNAKVLDDNLPDEGWSIDLRSPRGSALHGVLAHSPDDIGGFTTLSGNDSVATAALGFTLTLEGQTYSNVALSTNGWLEFGGNTAGGLASHPANTCLPNASHTNPFLAAYWDDMRTLGTAVRYGTVGSAGGRVFIADYFIENNDTNNHDLKMQVQVHERSNAITIKYSDSEAESNGQTATIGYQTAGGASAIARSIGCNAKVLDDNATRGEGWSIAQAEVCGDALVGPGEQCDQGVAVNGTTASCCSATCTFKSAANTCRASAGTCDVPETCTGASATCPGDGFVAGGTECRASGGECDLAEACTGGAAACPADAKQPNGTGCTDDGNVCTTDTCNGASNACQHPAGNAGTLCRGSAGDCDVAETCDGVSTSCPADAFVPSTTICRGAAGECDVADTCTGSGPSCPADVKQPGGTACTDDGNPCSADVCDGAGDACTHPAGNAGALCRGAAGDCDVAESCDGASTACPADGKVGAGTECRATAGDCDVAEACNGVGDACPADAFLPSSTECRASAGICDVAESCTGSGPSCPSDDFVASGTECRAAAGDCDVAESCTGSASACPTDGFVAGGTECRAAAGDCDVAESCDGATAACPADGKQTAGTECRASAGDCDVAEACDGSGDACPTDGYAPSTTECRAAAGDCDVAESCTGSGATCPSDGFVAGGTECRGVAGDCDLAESCTGSAAACPTDDFIPAGTECRASAGDCDPAEQCSGSGTDCPADSVSGAFVVCRGAAGPCDVAESCDGVGTVCPTDAKVPAATECRAAAGDCDVAESCDGATDACPADAKAPATTVCRGAAGDCDVAESCDGATNACPADAVAPATTVCRAAVDACDVAETCDGTGIVCPADSGAPDGDGDGTCDGEDVCPAIPDPGQADGDTDGLGDACDPCTNVFNGGVFAAKDKLTATKLLAPGGDDKLKLKGFITIPTTPAVAPQTNGVRLMLQTDDGTIIIDTTIPGGAYSNATRAGWKANSQGTKFTYKNAGKVIPLIDGIAKVTLGLSPKTPGLLKFGISGKNGTYGPVVAGDLPVKATLVIDVPTAETGQCGETDYGPSSCVIGGAGSTLKCK